MKVRKSRSPSIEPAFSFERTGQFRSAVVASAAGNHRLRDRSMVHIDISYPCLFMERYLLDL